MTFNVAMVLTADAAQAQAALRKTKTDLAAVGTTGAVAGRQAAQGANEATAATQRQTVATGGLARAQRVLTQQTLQTLGAGRALRAIGPALLSSLSPINLITFAVTALGATLVSSLLSGKDAANEFGDELKEAEGAAERMRSTAARTTDDLRKDFGAVTPEVRRLNNEMKALTAQTAILQGQAAARALDDLVKKPFGRSRQAPLADLLGGYFQDYQGQTQILPEIAEIDRLLTQLGSSKGVANQLELVRQIKTEVLLVAGGFNGLTADQAPLVDALVDVEQMLLRIQATQLGVGSAQQVANAELREAVAVREAENRIAALTLEHGRNSAPVAAARAVEERRVLEAMLATSDASEKVKDELRQALAVSQALARIDIASGVQAAATAASGLAMNLRAAVAQISQLRNDSVFASVQSAERARISLETVGNPVARAGRLAVADFRSRQTDGGYGLVAGGRAGSLASQEADVRRAAEAAAKMEEKARAADAAWQKLNSPGQGGGGGGGGAARDEADAVAELIARLREEIDIARESDSVQRELLRLREELTGATAGQRAEVEALVTQREREREAMEALNYVSEQAGDALIDALMGGKDAGEQLIRTLIRAVAQAALLGKGPLAALFGGVGLFGAAPGGGGLLGGLLRRSGGGIVTGPGGPTDDRIPALLSNGEFVVRAAAVERNRAALEAMNAGMVPRFAQGGLVGGGGGGGAFGDGAPMSGRIVIGLAPGLRAEIREEARSDAIQIVETGLGQFSEGGLPDRLEQIRADPRRRG
ncbi:MAG: hypothetical protein ACK4L4_07710 [Gemmobacter sp.]